MRALTLAFAAGLTVAASLQAAPLAPNPASVEIVTAPPFEQARDGCGRGWLRGRWRDEWGPWRWGRCIPNAGPHDAWREGWSYP
jgi:hypothetical protein